MAHRAEIDVAAMPVLRRLAEAVRDTQEPVLLRAENEDLAVLVPLTRTAEPRKGVLSQAQYDAATSTARSWRGLIDDVDKLKAELKAARGSNRPPVEL